MNLYTVTIQNMTSTQSFEKRFEQIYQALQSVHSTLDDLMEDPIFIDNIHGEDELGLDQSMELLETIMSHFAYQPPAVEVSPQFELESYDAD